jgi:hypothetical protein
VVAAVEEEAAILPVLEVLATLLRHPHHKEIQAVLIQAARREIAGLAVEAGLLL